jgi:hypothetical protein
MASLVRFLPGLVGQGGDWAPPPIRTLSASTGTVGTVLTVNQKWVCLYCSPPYFDSFPLTSQRAAGIVVHDSKQWCLSLPMPVAKTVNIF